MANHSIKKENNNNEIVYINGEMRGFDFNPKNSSNNNLKINQIVVVNPTMTDKILTIKFKQRYKRLLMIVLSILNGSDSDTTQGDIEIVLDEIAKMRDILLHKYKSFLKKEKEKVFLEQLRGLENSMRAKLQEMREYEYYINYMGYESSRGGR
ncbi:MAG: hypothetical protein J6B98_05495 [Bacilli bacterium]|nr:hypothetical protein [Bacilli bacterium]